MTDTERANLLLERETLKSKASQLETEIKDIAKMLSGIAQELQTNPVLFDMFHAPKFVGSDYGPLQPSVFDQTDFNSQETRLGLRNIVQQIATLRKVKWDLGLVEKSLELGQANAGG